MPGTNRESTYKAAFVYMDEGLRDYYARTRTSPSTTGYSDTIARWCNDIEWNTKTYRQLNESDQAQARGKSQTELVADDAVTGNTLMLVMVRRFLQSCAAG